MTYTSARPLLRSEQPPEKRLGEAVDALKAGVRAKMREFYNRPIPEGARVIADRIMGEGED